jgi:hypothetical protein
MDTRRSRANADENSPNTFEPFASARVDAEEFAIAVAALAFISVSEMAVILLLNST